MNISDIRAFRGGRLTHQPNSLDDLDENDTIPFDNVPVRYDTTGKWLKTLYILSLTLKQYPKLLNDQLNFSFHIGMFDITTNWSEPTSTTNPEMNQM